MSKVAENLPNMANPLSHMPPSLDAFSEQSPSSSPTEIQHPQPIRRVILPQNPSPGPGMTSQQNVKQESSPFRGSNSALYFGGESPSTHTPHFKQEQGLMFETYTSSPSVGEGVTPPIYGGSVFPLAQPRSIPSTGIESWNGFHQ